MDTTLSACNSTDALSIIRYVRKLKSTIQPWLVCSLVRDVYSYSTSIPVSPIRCVGQRSLLVAVGLVLFSGRGYWQAMAQLWVLANPACQSHYSFVKGIHTEVPQQPRRSPIHVTRKVHGQAMGIRHSWLPQWPLRRHDFQHGHVHIGCYPSIHPK